MFGVQKVEVTLLALTALSREKNNGVTEQIRNVHSDCECSTVS